MIGQSKIKILIPTFVLGAFVLTYWLVWGGGDRVVVYCAHDSVYSRAILDRFEEETGIGVDVKFDTEATKSLGLVELIASERGSPRCDVFWNNELLGSIRLAESGCLEPYVSPASSRFPEKFKDPEGHWTGFAGRLRVFIINRTGGSMMDKDITKLLESDDLSGVAIAKPLYGTTLTHYAALWEELGPESLKDWHRRCRDAGIVEANGNAAVKELVATGVCKLGFTDTDDTFVAIDAGHPVSMKPVRLPSGKTICIPNTVSIVKGGPHPELAEKLVDFLLSEKVEIALAQSRSRQIPLGSLSPDANVPADVVGLLGWASEGADLKALSEARNRCLEWLKGL